eukprot:793920-Prymnesium_polylepis.1
MAVKGHGHGRLRVDHRCTCWAHDIGGCWEAPSDGIARMGQCLHPSSTPDFGLSVTHALMHACSADPDTRERTPLDDSTIQNTSFDPWRARRGRAPVVSSVEQS